MDFRGEVEAAAQRIAPHVRETPVEFSPHLSEVGNCRVHLKLENLQRTGSFKLRGAMNKLLTLEGDLRGRGVVAASTGNHGAAVAQGAADLGCHAVIFAPESAARSKLEAMRARGAEVRLAGDDCVLAERAARAFAEEQGLAYVSPYNDAAVVAGQGTIGWELDRQLEKIDALVVAVGGGGLVSGVAGYLKAVGRQVDVIGCSPENSAVMHASLAAGQILDLESRPTLSDGTAGGVEPDSITFALCREVIDDFVLVNEAAIADGMRSMVAREHLLVEGAAGVAVAAYLERAERFAGKDVVVLLCGANVDAAVLKELL